MTRGCNSHQVTDVFIEAFSVGIEIVLRDKGRKVFAPDVQQGLHMRAEVSQVNAQGQPSICDDTPGKLFLVVIIFRSHEARQRAERTDRADIREHFTPLNEMVQYLKSFWYLIQKPLDWCWQVSE